MYFKSHHEKARHYLDLYTNNISKHKLRALLYRFLFTFHLRKDYKQFKGGHKLCQKGKGHQSGTKKH